MDNTNKNIRILIQNESILGQKSYKGNIEYLKLCCMCGSLYGSERIDKLTCGNNCKAKLTRRLKTGMPVPFNQDNVVVTEKLVKKAGYVPENINFEKLKKYGLK